MADEKEKTGKEEEAFEVLEVGPDGKPISAAGTAGAETTAGGADTSAGASGTDDLDDDFDERVALSEEDRAARREERKLRAERRKELNRRRELELVELRRKNEEYERRLAAVEQGQGRVNIALLNDKIGIAEQQLRQAESIFTAAMANAAKEPGKVTEALRIRDAARDQHARLMEFKTRVEARGTEEETRPSPERRAAPEDGGLHPAVRQRVDDFAKKHSWYDLRGGNTDSRIMQAVDQEVAEAGFDPATPEYWKELETRAAKVLPHRFAAGNGAGNGQNGGRRAPPVAGSGSAAAPAGKRVVRVTPERRRAMEEAGAWDDPEKRQRMLKAYERYDREHPAA